MSESVHLSLLTALILLIVGAPPASAQLVNKGTTLMITEGASLTWTGNVVNEDEGQILLEGEMAVAGDITHNGKKALTKGEGQIVLNGEESQTIEGEGEIRFHQLSVKNQSSEGIILKNNLVLDGDLIMQSGNVDLNGHNIDLSTQSSLVGESNTSRVHGKSGVIRTTRILNGSKEENIAGLGIEISTQDNLGLTVIERGHSVQEIDGELSAARYYDLQSSMKKEIDATLRFHYLDQEVDEEKKADLGLSHSTDAGATWKREGGYKDTDRNYLEVNHVKELERWTIGNRKEVKPDVHSRLSSGHHANRIYPNPVRPHQKTFLQGVEPGTYKMVLIDAKGKEVYSTDIEVPKGTDSGIFTVSDLPTGNYFYTLQESAGDMMIGKLMCVSK